MAPLKDYYQLLEIAPTAPADEVKRAFRQQIARYHPDKVQHLGKEFQDIAADRATELTEAYHVLSDEGRRAEYDRARAAESGATDIRERLLGRLRVYDRARAAESGATEAAPASPSAGAAPKPTRSPAETTAAPPAPEPGQPKGSQFKQERATRDEFVRNAAMSRFHQALKAVGAEYTVAELRGFDVALVPKGRMFSRTKNPRLLGRFVSRVDAEAVGDAWKGAGQWAVPAHEEICVFLMGTSLAPADELATAIAEQRKKRRNMKLTLIPVDARDWDARMPLDAPGIAKTLLARLKSGV